jgi:exosortase/archaeosortase family protein
MGAVVTPTASLWWRPRAAWPAPAGAIAVPCRPTHLSPLAWLALQAVALWPHGLWAARRLTDGSDDPLGLLAVLTVLALMLRRAGELRVVPRAGWLAAAAVGTLGASVAGFFAPPLIAALIGAAALAAGLTAWWPNDQPRLPLALLLVLALPLMASLQYYAGFPLRVLTAEASSALLQWAGFAAERSGTAMTVQGVLVIVDAPCSGVQMAWLGYFCAASVAAWRGLRDAAFAARLPGVGAIVLAANVLRNTLLVALEARPEGLDPPLHEAIGLGLLALACAAVILLMQRGRR